MRALLVGACLALPLAVGMAPAPVQAQQAVQRVELAAQPLASALRALGQQTGLQIAFAEGDVAGRNAPAVSGALSPRAALEQLLAGSGLGATFVGERTVSISARAGATGAVPEGVTDLGRITLDGGAGAVWNGSAETVWETPGAVSVITTDQLDMFRGTSPSDLLRSAPGLFSSESRASGGLDVNIRGLQGQGRVAVTVDGTTNGNSVYRGYQGIGNRSYVDPDFIAGVSVDKGPGATTGAIGGTVAMRTFGVDDLVPEGERTGARLRFEVSGNSSEPYGSTMRGMANSSQGYTYSEGGVPQSRGLEGGSASLLLGLRGERLDMVLGFARRKTGNYHAGSKGSGAGDRIECPLAPAVCARFPNREFYSMGLTSYLPGEEVLNTATDNSSVLAKFDWRVAPGHVLSYGFNRYRSSHGETYPFGFWNNEQSISQTVPSTVDLDSHSLTWRWTPGNDLIDMTARIWTSELQSMTASSTGPSWTDATQWGADLGNVSRLSTGMGDLVLNYGLTWQSEASKPTPGKYEPYPQRWGSRESASLYLNGKWQALDWLSVSAGVRHHRFRSGNDRPGIVAPSVKDSATDWSLALAADVGAGVQLFASYDAATRMPSMFESLGGMVTLVSPDLRGERAKALEIGANIRRESLFLSGDTFDAKISWFDNQVSDYIHRRFDRVCLYMWNGNCAYWGQNMTLSNIDSMNMQGVELQAAWRRDSFAALFNATWYDGVEFCRTAATCVNRSLASDYATNQIPPKYSLSLTLSQRFLDDRLGVSARFTRVGPRAAEAEVPGYGAQPLLAPIVWKPYSTLDLHADYRITDGVTLYAAAENVTDVYYVDPLSLAMMPGPGRTLRLGLILGAQAASEADAPTAVTLPERAPVDWSGFHVGVHAGRGTMGVLASDFWRSEVGFGNVEGGDRMMPSQTDTFAGVQIGWTRVLDSGLVLGVIADHSAGTVTSKAVHGGREQHMSVQLGDVSTLGVRAGFAKGSFLFYGMAGIASAKVTSAMDWRAADRPYFEDKRRQSGIMLGAGMEYALKDGWSIFGEYRHLELGGKSWRQDRTLLASYYDATVGWTNELSFDQLRLGVNYRF